MGDLFKLSHKDAEGARKQMFSIMAMFKEDWRSDRIKAIARLTSTVLVANPPLNAYVAKESLDAYRTVVYALKELKWLLSFLEIRDRKLIDIALAEWETRKERYSAEVWPNAPESSFTWPDGLSWEEYSSGQLQLESPDVEPDGEDFGCDPLALTEAAIAEHEAGRITAGQLKARLSELLA